RVSHEGAGWSRPADPHRWQARNGDAARRDRAGEHRVDRGLQGERASQPLSGQEGGLRGDIRCIGTPEGDRRAPGRLRDDENGTGSRRQAVDPCADEKRGAGSHEPAPRSSWIDRSTQFRAIVTGPFVVCTRIGFPPPPSGMLSSRVIRPDTVTGMSVRIGPLTVPTSSDAAYVSGTVSRTAPLRVSASSPTPSQALPASRTLSDPFRVCARTSPAMSEIASEPFHVSRSSLPETALTPRLPLCALRSRSKRWGT